MLEDQNYRPRFQSDMPYSEYKQLYPDKTPRILPIKINKDIQIPFLKLPPTQQNQIQDYEFVTFDQISMQKLRKMSENIHEKNILGLLKQKKNNL